MQKQAEEAVGLALEELVVEVLVGHTVQRTHSVPVIHEALAVHVALDEMHVVLHCVKPDMH